MNRKSKLILAIVLFIILFVASVLASSGLHFYLTDQNITLDEMKIENMYQSILHNSQHRNMFLLFLSAALTFIIFLFVLDNKTYQSRMMKITNRISIPMPAGQNQFGSARFLDKKEIDGAFSRYELTQQTVSKLMQEGEKDKKVISNFKPKEDSKTLAEEVKAEIPETDKGEIKALKKQMEDVVEKHISKKINSEQYRKELDDLQKEIETREELIIKIDTYIELELRQSQIAEKIITLSEVDEAKRNEIVKSIESLQQNLKDIDELVKSKRITDEYAKSKQEFLSTQINENQNRLDELNLLEEYKKEHQVIDLVITGIKEELLKHSSKLIDSIKSDIEKEKHVHHIEEIPSTDNVAIASVPPLYKKELISSGGLTIGYKVNGKKEIVYYIDDDIHSIIIGSTRSGKSRCIVLQTIGTLALAGESMFITDPKGELYDYTNLFLRRLDYELICLNFKNPRKSDRYNFLQPIIDAMDLNDMPLAIDATWDITAQLVGEAKGEKIWNNGEASIIAASIMAVVYDNRKGDRRKFQNMTNAYYFIAEMCKPIGKVMPLQEYMKKQPDTHPAKGLVAISEIAPERTRGSFFTAALTTLRLFTNPLIYSMTCTSDYDPKETGFKKRAIFVILPDEKTTYYSLAALLVSQHYIEFVKSADKVGGRLDRRINYILDEFGNFVAIPDFPTKLTVGGGRGIRFNLFLQAFAQLEDKYGKEVSDIIKGNCENWIYLQSDDQRTLEEFSNKLGKYTTSSYGLSSNHQKYNSPSSSSNMNLIGRELLTTSELQDIKRPYMLLTSRNKPVVMELPDLSKWYFNKMYGLGNKKHNTKIRMYRESLRVERKSNEMALWGIWKRYQQQLAFGGSKGNEGFREQVIGSEILEKHIRKDESYE